MIEKQLWEPTLFGKNIPKIILNLWDKYLFYCL